MDQNEATITAGAVIAALAGLWNAVIGGLEKRGRRQFEESLQLAKVEEAKRQADRDEAENIHRRKMEELQLVNVRQANLAAKKAQEAVATAVASQEVVVQAIEASKQERAGQIAGLGEKIDKGIDVSNGYNGKIATAAERAEATAEEVKQLRQDFQAGKPSTSAG